MQLMQTSRAGGAGRGAPHQLRVPRARFTRIIPRLSHLSNIKRTRDDKIAVRAASQMNDDDTELKPFSFGPLRHRAVIVRANGFVYRGRLHGVDETDLYLRGELRWWVLPLPSITSVVRDQDASDDDDDDPGAAS